MEPQSKLDCILRSALIASMLTLSVSIEAAPRASLTNSRELEKYAIDVVDKINKTALIILSTSPDQRTFENTLGL